MTELVRDLWEIDTEADWVPEDIQTEDHGAVRLKRYLRKILKLLRRHAPQSAHSYVAITGIESGLYKPIASDGRPLEGIRSTSTSGKGTLVASTLAQDDEVILLPNPQRSAAFCGDPKVLQKMIIKLRAHGELFGFVSLDAYTVGAFSDVDVQHFQRALPVLARTVSDAVFLVRLRLLGAPFTASEGESGLRQLYDDIVARAAHGFGADGAVLRIYDPANGVLVPEASHGDVPPSFLTNRHPGEGICGKVFTSEEFSWALGMPDKKGNPTLSGVPLSDEDERQLTAAGVSSYLLMRLTSQLRLKPQDHLGTLSFFHVRSRRYSWRDVAIFKSFCQRAADTIALYNTNLSLEETLEKLRLQSLQITRVEMVALLGHDLSHKVFEASTNVDAYSRRVSKALAKDTKSLALIEPLATKALTSLVAANHTLGQIRSMYQSGLDPAGRERVFSIADVIGEIEETLAGALERNRIELRKQFTGSLQILGFRTVLSQALYNLTLNSIESIKSSRRGSAVFIHAHEERQGDSRRIVINFWDDGPGINQREFPNPQDVFLIGRSTKPGGTGTGLPVTRSLLTQYFKADLSLEDPKKALFRMVIPIV